MSLKKYQLIFDIAERVSQESTCPRMQAGAVIFTPDYHLLSSGFNGSPHGLPHCSNAGCLLLDGHCARSVHAETNAVIQSARMGGAPLRGMYIASTNFPCPACSIILLQAGLKRIYYKEIAPTYSEAHRDLVKEFCGHLGVVLKSW